MECAIKIVSLWRTKNSHVCDEVSTIWAWKGQTGAALREGGERGKLGQILAKFASPQNPKGNLWQLLSTTQYDLAPGSCVKSTRAYNSRICPRFCPCPVSGKVSTRSEGILCMARVKGRRASSNHLGCSLREPNEAKHAKLIFNNNILSIVWKTDV